MTMSTPPARLRRRLEEAAERIIAALDALDAPDEDIEDDGDAEEGGDAEPSLGSTHGLNQEKTSGSLNRAQSWHGEDLEFEGDTVEDCDAEDGHDQEDDPAETGIGDADGLVEQITGEPSLGSTNDIDQRVAWRATGGGCIDGEATGTIDDLGTCGVDGPTLTARMARQEKTRGELRDFLGRLPQRTEGVR